MGIDELLQALITGPPATSRGFNLVDTFSAELLFVGVALFAAIGALSYEEERPFSAAIVYLGIGFVAAAGIHLLDVDWIDPFDNSSFIDHLTEVALIVALFASGLRIQRALTWRGWRGPLMLILVAMPATIALVAVYGSVAMGLPLGVAIVLGSVLAPTDPVLAGGVGLAPPGKEREEREARFTLTGEASLNDALAGPFVLLGFFVVERDDLGWLAEWALADMLYAVVLAVVLGGVAGYAVARAATLMRERHLLRRELDGFLVIGAVLLIYGLVDVLDAYGFLAVFAAGVGFRRYEAGHEYNRRAHGGAQVAQNFLELAVILMLGSLVTFSALEEPGLAGWLLVPLLLLVIRPLVAFASLGGSGLPTRQRLFIGALGVRGVASIHYVALALEENAVTGPEAVAFFWTVAFAVMASILVHGVSADPLDRRLLER